MAVVYKPVPRPVMCVGVRAMRGGTLFFVGSQLLWEGGALVMYFLEGHTCREVFRRFIYTYMYIHVWINHIEIFTVSIKMHPLLVLPVAQTKQTIPQSKDVCTVPERGGVIDKVHVSIRYSQ